MKKSKSRVAVCCFTAVLALSAGVPVVGDELLVNGDFEKGASAEDKSPSFDCPGWRRLLWKPTEWNAWLTDGARDHWVGQDNQALEFRWDASSICQYFSAEAGQPYSFSIDTFNPGTNDNRWQPRIQVQWYDAGHQPIGGVVTVAETDNATAPPKQWNPLGGRITAPAGTAYGRLLLNLNNRGIGQMWVSTFLDNASVQGTPGTNNLPASFTGSPYPMTLTAIPESEPYHDSLTRYADDKDGDSLTFTRISGPAWLAVQSDGTLTGTPAFEDAGDNELMVKVSDGRGSSDTQTLNIPVWGLLRLSNLFDDDMVLQREQPLQVWGHTVAGAAVRVEMSSGEHAETTSDKSGAWSVTLPAMKPSLSGPLTMTVKSGIRTLALTNLLVGDVWVCSGQSNMAWPLDGTDGSREAIAAAIQPTIRLLTNPDTQSPAPWNELPDRAQWEVCTPSSVRSFSAVAYYFGKRLNNDTGLPIGLISASQGGTRIEPWTGGPLYNARIHPYTRLPVKGVIWYQGEANLADGSAYTEKLTKMVRDWRSVWNSGDFPFLYVQVAPFAYPNNLPTKLPELWEAQTRALALIPNSGMAVINDLGDVDNIHPRNKAPVGERLALLALHGTYGQKDLVCSGPMARAVSTEGQGLRVAFDHAGGGLSTRDGGPVSWFEIAGADESYVAAEARIDGDSVVVSAPSVPEPQWVRFAWANKAVPNLMNKVGLPANSFRMKATGSTK